MRRVLDEDVEVARAQVAEPLGVQVAHLIRDARVQLDGERERRAVGQLVRSDHWHGVVAGVEARVEAIAAVVLGHPNPLEIAGSARSSADTTVNDVQLAQASLHRLVHVRASLLERPLFKQADHFAFSVRHDSCCS